MTSNESVYCLYAERFFELFLVLNSSFYPSIITSLICYILLQPYTYFFSIYLRYVRMYLLKNQCFIITSWKIFQNLHTQVDLLIFTESNSYYTWNLNKIMTDFIFFFFLQTSLFCYENSTSFIFNFLNINDSCGSNESKLIHRITLLYRVLSNKDDRKISHLQFLFIRKHFQKIYTFIFLFIIPWEVPISLFYLFIEFFQQIYDCLLQSSH